jgi:hypothetical protein
MQGETALRIGIAQRGGKARLMTGEDRRVADVKWLRVMRGEILAQWTASCRVVQF